MGRQSSRIYYQGKDHKEIYFQGHYHKAMYIGDKLLWQKLPEIVDKYWVYTRSIGNGRYTHAIIKPNDKLREYWEFSEIAPLGLLDAKSYFWHNDKYFVYMARTIDTSFARGFVVSKDGVVWESEYIDTSKLGSYIYGIVPKWNGLIFANNINPTSIGSGNRYEYRYCPIENGMVDQDNSVLIYSDTIYSPTALTIEQTVNFSDVLILFNTYRNNGKYDAIVIDEEGNVYNNLFSLNSVSSAHYHGCLNGMYWIIDGMNVYTTRNPYSQWNEKRIFNNSSSTIIGAIEADNFIVLYITNTTKVPLDENTFQGMYTLSVYTTKDFETYQRVSIPDKLIVPIVGELYESDKKYVEFMLNYTDSAWRNPSRNDTYRINHTTISDMFREMCMGRMGYMHDEKIGSFNSILFRLDNNINSLYNQKSITIYIDNLFFAEKENNFAICESLYPIANESPEITAVEQ